MPTAARAPLSAFVVAYNREAIIGTCLRALAFADELIVIDKGSSDGTLAIAEALADRVMRVPWSPTVEETRAFAAEQCSHDWILFLDDDECLDPQAVRFLNTELTAPRADIYLLPQRHYILGIHDERAYYWPEHQMRCFRRGSIAFTNTVHDGIHFLSDRVHTIPADSGPCIHHLSHRDVAQWIEKTNRYTSQPDRKRSLQTSTGLARYAHDRIAHWLEHTKPSGADEYPEAAAVLRAVYDMIDRLKGWEEERGIDGGALMQSVCARLDASYASKLSDLARPRNANATVTALPSAVPVPAVSPNVYVASLARAVDALRDSVAAHREAMDATRAELAIARQQAAEKDRLAAQLADAMGNARALSEAKEAAEHAGTTLSADKAELEQRLLAAEQAGAALRREAEALRADKAGLEQRLLAAEAAAARAENQAAAILASRSWRLMAPLRGLGNVLFWRR